MSVPLRGRSWLYELPETLIRGLDCGELVLTPDTHAEWQRARVATRLKAFVAAYRATGPFVPGGAQLCSRLPAKHLSCSDRHLIQAAEREAGVLFVAYEHP